MTETNEDSPFPPSLPLSCLSGSGRQRRQRRPHRRYGFFFLLCFYYYYSSCLVRLWGWGETKQRRQAKTWLAVTGVHAFGSSSSSSSGATTTTRLGNNSPLVVRWMRNDQTDTANNQDDTANNKDTLHLLTFRPVTADDLPRCVAIETASYPADEAASPQALAYRQAQAADYFLVCQAEEEDATADPNSAGEDQQRPARNVIGFVCGTRCTEFTEDSMSSTHQTDGPLLAIHSVVVDAPYRRQGVARRMLRAYLEHVRRHHHHRRYPPIRQFVLLAKAHLLAFYVQCGFTVLRPSPIVHGQELWYELVQDFDMTPATGEEDGPSSQVVTHEDDDDSKRGNLLGAAQSQSTYSSHADPIPVTSTTNQDWQNAMGRALNPYRSKLVPSDDGDPSSSSSSSSIHTAGATADTRRMPEECEDDDPFWAQIRREGQRLVHDESDAGPQLYQGILSQPSLLVAVVTVVAHQLETELISAVQLKNLFLSLLTWDDQVAIRMDLQAVATRSPSVDGALSALLFHNGFHALTAYRVGHRLWKADRKALAYYMQSVVSRKYSADIHPACQMGHGIYLRVGGGVVIGETAVVGNDVSILEGVTLGGTGKESGDRHPKIGNGVIIYDGGTVLGNIHVSDGAVVRAKAIVTKPVPPLAVMQGVPAKITEYRTLTADAFGDDLQSHLWDKYGEAWKAVAEHMEQEIPVHRTKKKH